MKLAILFALVFCLNAQAQQVDFQSHLSWAAIQDEAKNSHKYIFVDVFATWCAPCKEMDTNVFSADSVCLFLNDHFISVRAQIDSSRSDNALTRRWYSDAAYIKKRYSIGALPTFLFFSPDGKLVHKGVGYKNASDFLYLAAEALDKHKQLYSLLDKFYAGTLDISRLPQIAKGFKSLGEIKTANEIAKKYKISYFDKLNFQEASVEENIQFMKEFPELINSTDNFFKLCYYRPDIIAKYADIGYPDRLIEYVIFREQIDPIFNAHERKSLKQIKWSKINRSIAKRYNQQLAHKIILRAKIRWYTKKYDWNNLVKSQIKQVEDFGFDTTAIGQALLNNMIYEVIFLHAEERLQLQKGADWMTTIIEKNPDATYIDTYANLLYKMGRVKEGLEWQKKAMAIAPGDKEIAETYIKMQNGKPTWKD